MVNVSKSENLAASADTVWAIISGFNSLGDWHPAVEKSEISGSGIGAHRTLSLVGGGTIVEELLASDDTSYTYSIIDSPLPVANYQSTISVSAGDTASQCIVSWTGDFDSDGASDADAMGAISGVYQSGLDALRDKFGG